jgi:TPR repeat protein
MYENGHGVLVDLMEAYKWYSLAAEGEDDFWGAHRKRDEIRARLKPQERSAAEEAVSAIRRPRGA